MDKPLYFMSQSDVSKWEAECAAAATPSGAVKHIRVTLAEASRDGRAMVAGGGTQPAVPGGSKCSLSRGRPQIAPPTNRRRSPAASALSHPSQSPATARKAAALQAEEEQREAIARYRPFIQVAAVSAAPRSSSPDPFGLGRHLAINRRVGYPPRGPRGRREDDDA